MGEIRFVFVLGTALLKKASCKTVQCSFFCILKKKTTSVASLLRAKLVIKRTPPESDSPMNSVLKISVLRVDGGTASAQGESPSSVGRAD